MRTRKAYDSAVVFLYSTGREHLLPPRFRRNIPPTTIASWRKTDYTKYLGHEFRQFFEHALSNLELQSEFTKLKSTLWSVTRAWIHLKKLIHPLIKDAGNEKKTQRSVLTAVESCRTAFGLKRTLKLFGISHGLYRQWAIESQFDCFDSFTAICSKRHPHQLAKTEVVKMKKMLSAGAQNDHWPISSIHSHAERTGKLVANLDTWYKYARLLGITKASFKKEHKKIGLRATHPNEYWHVDTTVYPLMDGSTVWIAFVVDNYSKMIIGYHVLPRRTFRVVIHALRQAVLTASKAGDVSTNMVMDGGTENHNKEVIEFIKKQKGYKLNKLRALKDIRFSNAPVEMVNRTIKGQFLRGRKFENIKALYNFLDWSVKDYNEFRPHYRHLPFTPSEVYYRIPLSYDRLKRKKNARAERLKTNKCVACLQCTDFKRKNHCSAHG